MTIAGQSTLKIDFEDPRVTFGYDSLKFAVIGNTALDPASVVLSDNSTSARQTSFEIRVATSEEELNQIFAANAQAEGAFLGATVKGSASLLSETKMSATSVTVVATVSVVSASTVVDLARVRLSEEAASLGAADFYAKYGNFYLSRLIQGGDFVMFLTVTTNSLEEKLQVAAALNVTARQFSAGADFKAELAKAVQSRQVQLRYAQAGGAKTPSSIDADTLIQFAVDFPNNVASSPRIIAAEFVTYASVANGPAGLQSLLLEPSKNVDDLATFAAGYEDAVARAAYFIGVASQLGASGDDLRKLEDLRQQATDDLGVVRRVWNQIDPTKIPSTAALLNPATVPRRPFTLHNSPAVYMRAIDDMNLAARVIIRFGDGIVLQSRSGQYITSASYEGGHGALKQHYPHTGSTGAVTLNLVDPTNTHSSAEVKDGDTVNLVTTETSVGENNTLSAFSTHYIYWYDAESKYDMNQRWKLTRKGGNAGSGLRVGDQVVFENVHYRPQVVMVEDSFLTTKKPEDPDASAFTWIISRPSR
jgi:hypothetical protein